MSFEPELPWNSPKFRERKDTPWVAGCRWLQSWWREQQQIQPGERTDISETLVGAMFPVDTDAECNFFGPNVIAALEDRVINGAEFGVVPTEVLFRSLLEKQVLIFNLLGEFVEQPDELLPWVQTIDPDAAVVTEIRIEWQPERKPNLGGGPGFDGFVDYRAEGKPRFLALEVMYAEDRDKSKLAAKPNLLAATEASPHWRDGASRRLDRTRLRPLWITTLVAQALVTSSGYDEGRVVSLACAADQDARLSLNFVRSELVAPNEWLVASSLDAFVEALAPAHAEWADYITTRYLDFTPVHSMLAADDPRCGAFARVAADDDLRRLMAVGQKVSGDRNMFKRALQRLDEGNTDPTQIAALQARAEELAADLEAFWQALAALDG